MKLEGPRAPLPKPCVAYGITVAIARETVPQMVDAMVECAFASFARDPEIIDSDAKRGSRVVRLVPHLGCDNLT